MSVSPTLALTTDAVMAETFAQGAISLNRKLRDRRVVARCGSLTGSPDESGSRSREKGLTRAVNARAAGHDPTGLAVPDVPEGKRAGEVVRGAHRRRAARRAQDDDRRVGAQVVDRPVALVEDGVVPDRRRAVRPGGLSRNIERLGLTETSAPPALS